MDLNSVLTIGRLTRDAEVSYTTNGYAIGNLSIATNHMKDEVSYFNIKIINAKLTEGLKQYLTKGKQIAVEGYLKQERWEKDGQKQSRIIIIANNVQLLGGRSESGQSAPQDGYGNGYGFGN